MPVCITIKKGKCQGGFHAIGDEFYVDNTTPGGMCLGAWDAVSPYVTTLLWGGRFPWGKKDSAIKIHCPDPKGITLEVRRIENKKQ